MNKTFAVKRSEWFRGRTGSGLCLSVGEKGTQRCCLGFYGNQVCGLTDAQLRSAGGTPQGTLMLKQCKPALWGELVEPDDSEKKRSRQYQNSSLCFDIMNVNDNRVISDAARESTLKRLFAELGDTIHFID